MLKYSFQFANKHNKLGKDINKQDYRYTYNREMYDSEILRTIWNVNLIWTVPIQVLMTMHV